MDNYTRNQNVTERTNTVVPTYNHDTVLDIFNFLISNCTDLERLERYDQATRERFVNVSLELGSDFDRIWSGVTERDINTKSNRRTAA